MKRISDEEISNIIIGYSDKDAVGEREYKGDYGTVHTIDVYPLLDAQLAACEKQVAEVDEEKLREEIARYITILRGLPAWEHLPDKQTKECGVACKEACYRESAVIIQLANIHFAAKLAEKNKEITAWESFGELLLLD